MFDEVCCYKRFHGGPSVVYLSELCVFTHTGEFVS